MKFVVGCDLEEFKRYYRTLDDLHSYFKTLGLADVKLGELGKVEAGIIKRDPSHLIVWREKSRIIGQHWKGFLAERRISLSFTKSG